MNEDRDLITDATSRRQAWESVEARWPDQVRYESDYSHVHDLLSDYFAIEFPHISPAMCHRIVELTVRNMMADRLAHWSAGHSQAGDIVRVDAATVGSACRDAFLDQAADPHNISIADSPAGPSVRDDEWLAALAVGAQPEAVRDGLRQLAAEQAWEDFLIVTQYLDLADRDRTRPPRSADVVALLGGVVTELASRQAIVAFRDRLSRIEQRNATA